MRLETDDVEAVAGAARPGIAEALRRRLAGGRGRRLIAPLVLVAVAIYLGSGVFTVAADEQAVVRRFGRVTARLGPGIHYRLPWPVERADVLKTTTVVKTGVGFDLPEGEAPTVTGMEVLTGDTNIISVAMTYWSVMATLMMLVSPVRTSIPVTVGASPSGRSKPTPVFTTVVVFSTSARSTGHGRR